MGVTVDRRDFLRVAGVGGAAGLVGLLTWPDTAWADGVAGDARSGVVGQFRSVQPGELTLEISGLTGGTPARVAATPDAHMYSGAFGAVLDIGDFLVGDWIAVQGRESTDGISATAAGSLFTSMPAFVDSVNEDGTVAETSLGPIELNAGHLPFTTPSDTTRRRPTQVSSGDTLTGFGWTHPTTGERYLLIATA